MPATRYALKMAWNGKTETIFFYDGVTNAKKTAALAAFASEHGIENPDEIGYSLCRQEVPIWYDMTKSKLDFSI